MLSFESEEASVLFRKIPDETLNNMGAAAVNNFGVCKMFSFLFLRPETSRRYFIMRSISN